MGGGASQGFVIRAAFECGVSRRGGRWRLLSAVRPDLSAKVLGELIYPPPLSLNHIVGLSYLTHLLTPTQENHS